MTNERLEEVLETPFTNKQRTFLYGLLGILSELQDRLDSAAKILGDENLKDIAEGLKEIDDELSAVLHASYEKSK